ncbi:MAG: VWA domain-containing protein [Deltaproteobacteria bacterium]|nr:VWA domain-containing protein [Deltaproteobacteria bacterium]
MRDGGARFIFLCITVFVLRCSSPGLEAVRPQQVTLDDLLQVNVDVCTQPAADALFPVKVLFVVDTSNSMIATDPQALRATAVSNAMQRFAGNPAVQFGVIAFDARIDQPTPSFTNSPNIGAVSTRLSVADRLTDYQGALGAAYSFLSQDMQNSSAAERARTKYVVIFFTDGIPDPQCSATTVDTFLGVCEVDRQNWQAMFGPQLDPSLYPALQMGGDYNQPYQITKAVDDILELQDAYKVAEVRVHSALLFDPTAVNNPLATNMAFYLDRPRAVSLLTDVAAHGQGTFTEFSNAQNISFLNFNYTSVKEPNALADLVVTNTNAIFADEKLQADTDGDGLPDAREFELKTCVGLGQSCSNPADSDGDSYSDFFEDRFRESGFDPLDRNKPLQACRVRNDSDGDGLRDCEEQFLGTDARLFDSDGDRLTDLQELRGILDPLDATDSIGDSDNDGMRNIDEIRTHLNPNVRNSPHGDADVRYRYLVNETETRPDGRVCYHGEVRNIRLLTTGTGTDSPRGASRVFVSFIEAPTNRPLDFGEIRQACVDVRYVAGAVKSPASGVIDLKDENFKTPTALDVTRDCVRADAP